MSACTLIAADFPLREAAPSRDYPLEINIDKGIIYDGGADDNYFLNIFADVADYSDKKYAVSLDWHYTDGRARQIIAYIKEVLQETETVEFWHVWLMDYYEFEDRPYIHRKTISIDELTTENIKAIDESSIWNTPDRMYPNRPSFYCLTVTR